jgi:DNA-directed RNA polymerase subunit N (RpoN/RPB10)
MLPIRCFTCNHFIGPLWEPYVELGKTKDGKTCLDELGLKRVCCRRMLLTHVPIIADTMLYSNKDTVLDECNTVFLSKTKHEREVHCV